MILRPQVHVAAARHKLPMLTQLKQMYLFPFSSPCSWALPPLLLLQLTLCITLCGLGAAISMQQISRAARLSRSRVWQATAPSPSLLPPLHSTVRSLLPFPNHISRFYFPTHQQSHPYLSPLSSSAPPKRPCTNRTTPPPLRSICF